MWKNTRSIWFAAAAFAVLLSGCGGDSETSAVTEIRALSSRADLISGGDALVEVVLPQGIDATQVVVRLNGNDVSSKFKVRTDGRVIGLVDQLVVGTNSLSASIGSTGKREDLVITNHAIGGPVFSGPQLQPWPCTTEANGLGPAIDAQCNAPTRYKFVYKDASSGEFKAYDQVKPPAAASIAKTTTDQGKTVPYIVRIETGTINRGIHDIAVLFDASNPPTSLAAWNGKLQWIFGCGAATSHSQATHRSCGYISPEGTPETQVLAAAGAADYAVSRGFAVVASTLTNNGNNMNTVVQAETIMMVKEHIIEQYGPIRYTIGQGGSGGAIAQHAIANQYPGLLDGLTVSQSFADVWGVLAVGPLDCGVLNNYFDNIAPALWSSVAQRDAVYGFGVGQPGESGTAHCHSAMLAFSQLWDPTRGEPTQLTLQEVIQQVVQQAPPLPCVPQDHVYGPTSNPSGVRCSAQDYMVNVFGRRPTSAWGTVEQQIGRGFANRFLDRVGVQYGVKALQGGVITPEQFVDLNEKVGGWDIDAKWRPQRTEADLDAVSAMYRTGQLAGGAQLATVPIIDYRADQTGPDIHTNLQTEIMRKRLLSANGTAANRAVWISPGSADPFPLPTSAYYMQLVPLHEVSFLVMDEWLARVEADREKLPLAQKIIRNRPASAADGCFANGERADHNVCAGYAIPSDPMLEAGMPETRDILKCQLKPLLRNDYSVVFTDTQWARLNNAFPAGVCDWSKPGVGQVPNIPWLTFAGGPGGEPLGHVTASPR